MSRRSIIFPVLSLICALSALQAAAADDIYYFEDLRGGCHSVKKDELADPEKIHDVTDGYCDGSHGKYLGQDHFGRRDGHCVELTPKSTIYKNLPDETCEG